MIFSSPDAKLLPMSRETTIISHKMGTTRIWRGRRPRTSGLHAWGPWWYRLQCWRLKLLEAEKVDDSKRRLMATLSNSTVIVLPPRRCYHPRLIGHECTCHRVRCVYDGPLLAYSNHSKPSLIAICVRISSQMDWRQWFLVMRLGRICCSMLMSTGGRNRKLLTHDRLKRLIKGWWVLI